MRFMDFAAPLQLKPRPGMDLAHAASRAAFILANCLLVFEGMVYFWLLPALGLMPPVSVEAILVVLALLTAWLSSRSPSRIVRQCCRPLLLLMAIPLVTTGIRFVLRADPDANWSHRYVFSSLILGISIFLLSENLCSTKKWLRRLVLFLFAAVLLSSVMGLGETVLNRSWPWSEWYDSPEQARLLRLAATQSTISSFVTSVLPASCLAFSLWLYGSRLLKLPRWFVLAAVLVPVLALVLGSSRSGILAFALAAGLIFLSRRINGRHLRRTLPFAVPALILLTIAVFSRKDIVKLGFDDVRLQTTWQVYLPIIACHPEGYPWVKGSPIQKEETIRCHEKITGEPPSARELHCQQILSPHNFFMVTFLQFGWLGGFACVAIYGLLLFRGGRIVIRNRAVEETENPWVPLVIGLVGANVAVLVNMFFHDQNIFLGKSSLWLYLGLLSGASWYAHRWPDKAAEKVNASADHG